VKLKIYAGVKNRLIRLSGISASREILTQRGRIDTDQWTSDHAVQIGEISISVMNAKATTRAEPSR
jgi:hypothetical protein